MKNSPQDSGQMQYVSELENALDIQNELIDAQKDIIAALKKENSLLRKHIADMEQMFQELKDFKNTPEGK